MDKPSLLPATPAATTGSDSLSTPSPPAAASGNASDASRSAMTVTLNLPSTPRPNQGAFTSEQTQFLTTYLPKYQEMVDKLSTVATGPRRTGQVKGEKGRWVLKTVYKPYTEKFDSKGPDGPNLESLQIKLKKWYSNHYKSALQPVASASTPVARPRATNAVELFAQDNQTDIRAKMAEQRGESGQSSKDNLSLHRKIKTELFNELDEETRLRYEADAAAFNASLEQPPDAAVVFAKQQGLISAASESLRKLCGWGWNGHGDVVFFVQAAYRDNEDHLKTFNITVSQEPKPASFVNVCTDFKKVRSEFRQFAEDMFPPKRSEEPVSTTTNLVITFNKKGLPMLPSMDPESIPVAMCRQLLVQYIENTWGQSNSTDVPWDILATPDRDSVGLVAHKEIDAFDSLDPKSMKAADALRLYTLIFDAQAESDGILKFTKATAARSPLPDDDGIVEILDEACKILPDCERRDAEKLSSPAAMDFTPQILQPASLPSPPSPPSPPSLPSPLSGIASSAPASPAMQSTSSAAVTASESLPRPDIQPAAATSTIVPPEVTSGAQTVAADLDQLSSRRGRGRGSGRGRGHGRGQVGGRGRGRDKQTTTSATVAGAIPSSEPATEDSIATPAANMPTLSGLQFAPAATPAASPAVPSTDSVAVAITQDPGPRRSSRKRKASEPSTEGGSSTAPAQKRPVTERWYYV
ncbi:hypothetical protein LshimejAT787_0109730 [Lyophyllum shimeji]|uniref:Uncharacterized protein n=1 Tax=Lyophyllum shimeji TaxID=47721 RepID=A0A9P3UHJ1_LYOSH|nr:hypothetical protein LshimejAT787_0109730 [Lyophyllum shimeji]